MRVKAQQEILVGCSKRITLKNVPIIEIDKEKNLLYFKGAIPGHKGSLVLIQGQ